MANALHTIVNLIYPFQSIESMWLGYSSLHSLIYLLIMENAYIDLEFLHH